MLKWKNAAKIGRTKAKMKTCGRLPQYKILQRNDFKKLGMSDISHAEETREDFPSKENPRRWKNEYPSRGHICLREQILMGEADGTGVRWVPNQRKETQRK